MIEITIHQFVVVLLATASCFACLGFAIAHLRGARPSSYTTLSYHDWRKMTPEQRQKFDDAWTHFGKGFDSMRETFERDAG